MRRLGGIALQIWQAAMVKRVRNMYADIGKESIHSAACVEDSVIPFRPTFPIVIAVWSPKRSAETAFQVSNVPQ